MIPEAEVFLGQIGLSKYETPGTPANAVAVGDAVGEEEDAMHGAIDAILGDEFAAAEPSAAEVGAAAGLDRS